jgi:hypothetical protein
MADAPDAAPTYAATDCESRRGNGVWFVDGSIGILSVLQVALGLFYVVALAANPDRRSQTPHHWYDGTTSELLIASTYTVLSAVAFFGSIRPARPLRRPYYIAYAIGLPLAVLLLDILLGVTSDPDRTDRDVYWQSPVLALIINPAFLVLMIRAVRMPLIEPTARQ